MHHEFSDKAGHCVQLRDAFRAVLMMRYVVIRLRRIDFRTPYAIWSIGFKQDLG